MTTVSRRIILLLAVAVLPVLLGACYTLFQHARLSELNYARPDDRCLDCHSQTQIHEFLHVQSTLTTGDVWDEFYNDPWWSARFLGVDSTHVDHGTENEDDDS